MYACIRLCMYVCMRFCMLHENVDVYFIHMYIHKYIQLHHLPLEPCLLTPCMHAYTYIHTYIHTYKYITFPSAAISFGPTHRARDGEAPIRPLPDDVSRCVCPLCTHTQETQHKTHIIPYYQISTTSSGKVESLHA